MLALIAYLDGVNAQLFHVEHCDNDSWEYRFLGADGEWCPAVPATGDEAIFALPHATAEVRAEWRPTGADAPGEWIPAVPHIYGPAECDFLVRVREPSPHFLSDPVARVCGVVRSHASAWLLDMPRRVLAADGPENLRVRGASCCTGIGQIIRAEAEFQCADSNFSVINAGPSQVALLPAAAAIPGVLPFAGAFFVKTGSLTADEIALLQQDSPPWQH